MLGRSPSMLTAITAGPAEEHAKIGAITPMGPRAKAVKNTTCPTEPATPATITHGSRCQPGNDSCTRYSATRIGSMPTNSE